MLAILCMAGCSNNRVLIGRWVAVTPTDVPPGMDILNFPDESQLKLSNGDQCSYEVVDKANVQITFPNGHMFKYGYTRSGENLTLVDGRSKYLYTKDQGQLGIASEK